MPFNGFTLDKGMKKAWCQALRSGEYKQGTGALVWHPLGESISCNKSTFCCLGVLANITGDFEGCAKSTFELENDVIPQHVQNELIEMNDDEGQTFTEIANWIEKKL